MSPVKTPIIEVLTLVSFNTTSIYHNLGFFKIKKTTPRGTFLAERALNKVTIIIYPGD